MRREIEMKYLYHTIMFFLLLEVANFSLEAKEKPFQVVRALIYRYERQDSCMILDMNIDLRQVRLTPDCTIFIYPWLRNGKDSVMLAPVMLNGPQSDLMYRRRKALGRVDEIEKMAPFVALREGDHPLPCINYRRTDIPYQSWMDNAEVVLHDETYNADVRLTPFSMQTEKVPPVVVERRDTVIIRDTVRIERQTSRPVYTPVAVPVVEKKKEIITEHAGYRADIYFPVGGMKILPEHELNREAWHNFVNELNTLRSGGNNTVMGITVTGYSSPEGSYESNEVVAKRRAEALKSFLETQYGSTLVEIRVEWVAEDWDRLAEMVRASGMDDKEQVLDIISKVDVRNGREAKIKALSGGKTWAYMLKEFFPKLRCATCRIGYLKKTER